MISAARPTLLARLRSSARLAALVLLVFALKISAVAACAPQDFADMGVGTGTDSSPVAVMEALPAEGAAVDLTEATLGYAGTCDHCSCHHAAAVVPVSCISLAASADVLAVRTAGLPPSASPPLELRPPIV